MTQLEQQRAARKFAKAWEGKGYEKGDAQKFWIDLIQHVFGVEDINSYINFELQVKKVAGHSSFIDAFIPSTKVLIEQKSIKVDLKAKTKKADGSYQSPHEQAEEYIKGLPYSIRPRWIVTSNFKSFLIYDQEHPLEEPYEVLLENFEREYYRLSFICESDSIHLQKELETSKKAGDIIGEIYDTILKQYDDADKPGEETLKSLNMLCVRIVFCLYAEDSGIFGRKNIFGDYVKKFSPESLRQGLLELFKVLDTPNEKRSKYLEQSLADFPYVNGGLFTEKDENIPQMTQEIKDLLVNRASSNFDWSDISPTIFGAIFESTLNPETRRSGGMHYTSIENIHKVIDPLFLDDLKAELESIKKIKSKKQRDEMLTEFPKKLGRLRFMDPACGSGNFLTETYIYLRKLENECLKLRFDGYRYLDVITQHDEVSVHVNIHQFYGIEINDFAVSVAKTALWIAESQMMKKTADILTRNMDFLPLKSYSNITEGNALKIDWNTVIPSSELTYLYGNPPFIGYGLQSTEQKEELRAVCVGKDDKECKSAGKIDYVSGWYYKAARYIQGTDIRCAFVSTNSITQGEQVSTVWKPLIKGYGLHIDFAYRTFRWDSEANLKAHVHCVIIGFSTADTDKPKRLYNEDNEVERAEHINPYLMNFDDVFIESRTRPICDVPQMVTGNRPADGGHLIIEADEYEGFIAKEPGAAKYIKKLTGSEEYIKNKQRYCLWLVNASPSELRKIPEVMKRIEECKKDRLKGAPDRQKLADTPAVFREVFNPEKYLIVPRVSSENRKYIPIGFLDDNTIPSDSAVIIPDAGLYEFGVLTSSVHSSWMRAVCGRLKSDYRYSKDIVYNNFPWPTPTDEQHKLIERTAQKILDARAMFSESSLADLYDSNVMPAELRKAHQENDKVVMSAYGFSSRMTEERIIRELFRLYEKLISTK